MACNSLQTTSRRPFFDGPYRDSVCKWCGRSRELVRHDDLPAGCLNRPDHADDDIADVIQREELRFWALLDKANLYVPKLVEKMGMSGETLSILHHTHGYDPECVSAIVNVPKQLMEEYHAKMEDERDRSRAAIVRNVITVKGI